MLLGILASRPTWGIWKQNRLIGITNLFFFFFWGPILSYWKFSEIYPENWSKLTLEKIPNCLVEKKTLAIIIFLFFNYIFLWVFISSRTKFRINLWKLCKKNMYTYFFEIFRRNWRAPFHYFGEFVFDKNLEITFCWDHVKCVFWTTIYHFREITKEKKQTKILGGTYCKTCVPSSNNKKHRGLNS